MKVMDAKPEARAWVLDHAGVKLEPAYLSNNNLASADRALEDRGMGIHLTRPSIIHDPTGELGRIQQVVSRRYAEPYWVRRRCQSVAEGLRGWFLPSLLRMARQDVEGLLGACIPAYDRAVAVHRTPLFLGHYLDPPARQGMIGGAQDLIDRGYHREATWWIFVTHFAARRALGLDAPREYERAYRGPYEALLRSLGTDTPEALTRKAALAEDRLTRVIALAESLIGGKA
jgi:hypothetical protein